jgi:hypothetical protein
VQTLAPSLARKLSRLRQPPLDPASNDPAAFLLFAKGLVRELGERMSLGLWASTDPAPLGSADAIDAILTQAGRAASTLLLAEFQHRFPGTPTAGIGESLFETYDRRLLQLACSCSWAGGSA